MCLVASSSPPLSPPPPCGDEKEEDSAEEEEADGGGGAPRDLGSARTGRGGPGTAPLRAASAREFAAADSPGGFACAPSPGPGRRPRPLALALTFLSGPHPFPGTAARRGEKGTCPPHLPQPTTATTTTPRGGRRSPPKPTPLPESGAGTPSEEEISRGFSFFLACISERIKNGRECGGARAAFSQAA